MSEKSQEPQISKQNAESSDTNADAYIQQIQRARAQRIKRGFVYLGGLFILAVMISALVAWQSKNENNASDYDALDAELATSFSSKEQEAARDAFKQALLAFENEVLPSLTNTHLATWQAKRVQSLIDQQEQALSLFARSGFIQALGVLNETRTAAEALIAQWHQTYDDKLTEAQSFYSQEQIQKARLALAQAEKIKPAHEDARLLTAQLAAYEQVMDYLAQLKVARVENNIEKQVRLLQLVLKADPTRSALQSELDVATTTLNDQRLSLALKEARSALAQNNLSKALTYVENAQEIRPGAPGIKALSEELAAKLASEDLNSLHQNIRKLSAQDAWEQALQTAKRGLVKFSNDAQLRDSERQASEVLRAQQSLQRFIARPERLADKSIREAAQASLQATLLQLSKSKTLAQQAQTLAALIDQYSGPVELTVTSDGKTYISVIGVGVVGKVENKVIELSPGNYTLEGKREGYRSKRISIELSANTPSSVHLVCDESI